MGKGPLVMKGILAAEIWFGDGGIAEKGIGHNGEKRKGGKVKGREWPIALHKSEAGWDGKIGGTRCAAKKANKREGAKMEREVLQGDFKMVRGRPIAAKWKGGRGMENGYGKANLLKRGRGRNGKVGHKCRQYFPRGKNGKQGVGGQYERKKLFCSWGEKWGRGTKGNGICLDRPDAMAKRGWNAKCEKGGNG